MDKESKPLLQTKLYIPPRRPNLVLRPRLMAQMDEALRQQHRLTLISARAGAGKTTLVSEWLHLHERPFAWLSLDENDNDPQRFFSYLMEAFRQVGIAMPYTGLGERDLHDFPSVETLVTELINTIAASTAPFTLVLDDYHILQNDWIHKAVEFLIEHQPPQMHLVLTTRVDPPLPLAQLRARGQLTEIRDRDLLFTTAEAVELLNAVMNLDLPDGAVDTIEQRTEGWIAGLQMAAISARGHQQDGDLTAFIEAFGGTNRFILDYLTEEVLNQQTPAVQDFLMETSILEQMCGDLCGAVSFGAASSFGAAADSQVILVELERTNLFVISLDDERRWYRYHHLFADLLQSILRQRRSAEQIRELHRRASQWYQGQGALGEAMSHLLAARDFERAADLIDVNFAGMLHMFSRSQAPLLLSWIEKLPEEVRHSRPWIDIDRANLLALALRLEEVEPLLADVEKRIAPGSPRAEEMQGHIASVRAYTANLRGDAGLAMAMAEISKKYLPEEEFQFARGMAAFTMADTYFAVDDMQKASQALMDLLRLGESIHQLVVIVPALCDLAAIQQVKGQLHQAKQLYDRAYQQLAERSSLETRVRCSYEFGLAGLLRERNQLDAAYEHAMTGIEMRRRFGAYNMIGDLALMRVLQARGDVEGAMQCLRKAEQAVQTYPFQLAFMIDYKTAQVTQWLVAGSLEMASRWARECSGGSELEQIALARLALAQGRAAHAQKLLARQASLAAQGERIGRLIEILSLQTVALDAQGLCAEAETTLSQAVALARPEGHLRVFLDLGQPLRAVLQRLARNSTDAGGDARVLLSAFQPGGGAETAAPGPALAEPLIEPLSERELEVLRLLAEGLTNKEIASRLFVAPGTIKQHLKNIGRKLDTRGRMQAVRRGRELKLL